MIDTQKKDEPNIKSRQSKKTNQPITYDLTTCTRRDTLCFLIKSLQYFLVMLFSVIWYMVLS